MTDQPMARYKTPFLILGGLFVLWGILGLVDLGNVPYSGYLTDGNNTVTRVDAGSPAERAGLKVGDYIQSIGGVVVEDARALARRGRPEIGETHTLVVERRADTVLGATEAGPATQSIDLTYTSQSGRDTALGWAAFIIGVCFVGFGLLGYLRAGTRSATLLALVGLCLGIAFFAGPYFNSYGLRALVGSVQTVLIVFGFAFLLHFMLETPQPTAFLFRKHALKIIYGPALLLALFVLFLIIVQPTATSGFNIFVNTLFGVFVVAYLGLSAVAMIRSYARATPIDRSRYGLNLMLAGILIGLLPVTIASLIGIFAPRVVLPGVDFYFLTLILIPISMAAAVLKQAGPAPMAAAT